MKVVLNPNSLDDYRVFLKLKTLPLCRFVGREATFPDEYAHLLNLTPPRTADVPYAPPSGMFDYQAFATKLSIKKRKFALFVECGYGKSWIILEYAKHAQKVLGRDRNVLIVCPLMVIDQMIHEEAAKFYPYGYDIEKVAAKDLNNWLQVPNFNIGITNYEAIREGLERGCLGALICDEWSCAKSAYSAWATRLIQLGKGLDWKLCSTGTPAPNDRIEYGNTAVFLDQYPTINSFYARYFVNRGQTDNRWEIKPHALNVFYRDMSHWAFFLTNPATYGFKDNASSIPPIHVHVLDVSMTDEQREAVLGLNGDMYGTPGGITSRSKLSQIAKGHLQGRRFETRKPQFIRDLVDSWPGESTLIWAKYNEEQKLLEKFFPEAGSIDGSTPHPERQRIIEAFRARKLPTVISKGDLLGYGLNLQVVTRQVFSGLEDSLELFHQCVKRSNRVGSTQDLHAYLPVTEVERPMIESVLRKAHRVRQDTEWQEKMFKENLLWENSNAS